MMALILMLLFVVSLFVGRYNISISKIMNFKEQSTELVMINVRLWRACGAIFIGGALGLSGAVYQGVFKNPMVSPDILGASTGASFGAAAAILLGGNVLVTQLSAFVFGLLSVMMTLFITNVISKNKGNRVLMMVLTGMVVSTVFSSFVSITKVLADPFDTLPAITFWLMGGLTYITKDDVLALIIPFVAGTILIMLFRWKLNVLSFDDDEAKTMGLNTDKFRRIFILCSTLITSSAVAVGGMIGWVGLIIPHLSRMIAGPDHKKMIPVSLLLGSTFLLLVDDIARSIFAQEIPLGIITSLVGGPFFLYLLFKKNNNWI